MQMGENNHAIDAKMCARKTAILLVFIVVALWRFYSA